MDEHIVRALGMMAGDANELPESISRALAADLRTTPDNAFELMTLFVGRIVESNYVAEVMADTAERMGRPLDSLSDDERRELELKVMLGYALHIGSRLARSVDLALVVDPRDRP